MFIDTAKIYVKAGNGGKGCHSIYTDKYTRYGIFDGGDGGRGADIVITSDRNLYTLLDFRYNPHFYGKHGGNGSGKNKKGRDAEAVVMRVPCGTTVTDTATGCVLRTLDADGESVIVARGGRGGNGNQHKADPTPGIPGEEKNLVLDLKLLADAGLVGFPNAGKSTLISVVSHAHPKVAAYPFTTKTPVLGIVRDGEKTFFAIADIPGLIEGSSHGKGLGDRFLRHVEKTRILVHIVDMSAADGRDPLQDYEVINRELKQYSRELARKPQVIVANKMDCESAAANLERFTAAVKKKVYPISALNRQGLEELIEAIRRKLKTRSR
ncbi:MAG: GTPase ObgE [Candidatus Omnitrophota bacterium]|jgi:GTP-binding protein